ncbi:MAG TPA: hypothetical protein PK564_02240 [bacterium]|jgi:hypothetical protein|uniref:Uncharacterized protein n=1 Tax=candidate division CPR1 bacterium ADurb.Bin160 TaxID=1852826 RepID=A0A1V5ZKI1_9BACT|nr:MAG: hypothetical protein BWY04_01238 [candidate division CPR1 bacterium ADurb.Bin160]HQG79137.1 hypothetical protein [bacterium]
MPIENGRPFREVREEFVEKRILSLEQLWEKIDHKKYGEFSYETMARFFNDEYRRKPRSKTNIHIITEDIIGSEFTNWHTLVFTILDIKIDNVKYYMFLFFTVDDLGEYQLVKDSFKGKK